MVIVRGVALGAILLVLPATFGATSDSAPLSEQSHQIAVAAPLGISVRARAAKVTCSSPTTATPVPDHSYAVAVPGTAVARARPGGGAILLTIRSHDINGYPTTLGVLGIKRGKACRPLYYRVELPVEDNGRTGWVAAWAVHVFTVRSRVVINLASRQLVAYRNGKPVLHAEIAAGTPSTPTPVGLFFVNERYLLANSNGPFGVAALGISAHSTVLRNWVEGGPVALHGTNEPSLVGTYASHGCVRMRNEDMTRLFKLAPAGTPVIIRP
jgi:lipoprotein-anchoring transpeptidase ErfK/SrfK